MVIHYYKRFPSLGFRIEVEVREGHLISFGCWDDGKGGVDFEVALFPTLFAKVRSQTTQSPPFTIFIAVWQ